MTILTQEFIRLYAVLLIINLVFITLVLRRVYYLIHRSDPIQAYKVKVPSGFKKILKQKELQRTRLKKTEIS